MEEYIASLDPKDQACIREVEGSVLGWFKWHMINDCRKAPTSLKTKARKGHSKTRREQLCQMEALNRLNKNEQKELIKIEKERQAKLVARANKRKIRSSDCSICHEQDDPKHRISLGCYHSFHKSCLNKWFSTGGFTCPDCRIPVPLEVVIDASNARETPTVDLSRNMSNWIRNLNSLPEVNHALETLELRYPNANAKTKKTKRAQLRKRLEQLKSEAV